MTRFALGSKDKFIFGPQNRPDITTASADDILFSETIDLTGSEKSIIPRSFASTTAGKPEILSAENSLRFPEESTNNVVEKSANFVAESGSSTPLPPNKINTESIENSINVEGAEVIRSQTPSGHSYRVTTPSSTVFVQRTFGITHNDPKPFKREIENKHKKRGKRPGQSYNIVHEEAVFNSGDDSRAFKNLQSAVDVLARSSLGYVNLNAFNPLAYFTEDSSDDDKDLVLPSFEHFKAKQYNEEPEEESAVRKRESVPQAAALVSEEPSQQQEAETEAVNIYAPENMDKIIEVMEDIRELSEKKEMLDHMSENINDDQLDKLLVENYLRKNQDVANVEQKAEDIRGASEHTEGEYHDDTAYFHLHKSKDIRFPGPEENEIESLPLAVPQVSEPRALRFVQGFTDQQMLDELELVEDLEQDVMQAAESINVPQTYQNSYTLPESKILVPSSINNSVYIPKIADRVNIAVSPRSIKIGSNQESLPVRFVDTDVIEQQPVPSHLLIDDRLDGELDPEHVTFQDNWVGMHANPVEQERRKRNQFSEEHQHMWQQQQQQQQPQQQQQQYRQARHLDHQSLEQHSRHRRDTSAFGELSHTKDDLSMEKIQADKQRYISQAELTRDRRQSSDPDQLCPTVAQYIMPRAAVNTDGDWMYVVNMPDEPEYQQFVRAEICISDTCRGLCSVPSGLQSKCSQQYVQKKLVALHPSGDKLVEDIFWFPSCCVCQVTQSLELK